MKATEKQHDEIIMTLNKIKKELDVKVSNKEGKVF